LTKAQAVFLGPNLPAADLTFFDGRQIGPLLVGVAELAAHVLPAGAMAFSNPPIQAGLGCIHFANLFPSHTEDVERNRMSCRCCAEGIPILEQIPWRSNRRRTASGDTESRWDNLA
jgi:hypothetical protein